MPIHLLGVSEVDGSPGNVLTKYDDDPRLVPHILVSGGGCGGWALKGTPSLAPGLSRRTVLFCGRVLVGGFLEELQVALDGCY